MADPPVREIVAIVKQLVAKVQRDQITDRAGAMTYQSLMALFPGLLLAVSLLGLAGQGQLYEDILEQAREVAPPDLVEPIENVLASVTADRDAAVWATVLALVLGLNGASGALAAAGSGLNAVLGISERRSWVERKLRTLGWTLLLIVLVLACCVLVFAGGGIASWALGQIGLGSTAEVAWAILRWPAAIAMALAVYVIVYYVAPDTDQRRFRYITPGAVAGVVLWIAGSAVFFLWVQSFDSYSRTYGTFATAVVLLIWLYLSNIALLLGAELNAVLDERRCGVSHAPTGPRPRRSAVASAATRRRSRARRSQSRGRRSRAHDARRPRPSGRWPRSRWSRSGGPGRARRARLGWSAEAAPGLPRTRCAVPGSTRRRAEVIVMGQVLQIAGALMVLAAFALAQRGALLSASPRLPAAQCRGGLGPGGRGLPRAPVGLPAARGGLGAGGGRRPQGRAAARKRSTRLASTGFQVWPSP